MGKSEISKNITQKDTVQKDIKRKKTLRPESKQSRPNNIDITVTQEYFNKKNNYKSSELCLKFGGKDCNFKILSTLRRACQNNVPTYAFNFQNIEIQENTSVAFNNDYMKLRLSQLPIFNVKSDLFFLHPKYWKNINFAELTREKHPDEKNIKIYINSHNNSNEVKPITTKDIKVYIEDTQVEMYDPSSPILIILLKPNQTFKCVMTSSLSVGDMHATYCACSNAWATYDNQIKDNGDTIFKEGNLFLKSRGGQSEYDILKHACEYLIKKFEEIKIEIERKVKEKEIDSDLNILILVLDDEEHTIGEMLNYELQDRAVFSAVAKPDHNIRSIVLKIETDGKKKPHDIIKETCDVLKDKFEAIIQKLKNN